MKSRLPAFLLLSVDVSGYELIKEARVFWSLRNSCGDLIHQDLVRILMEAIMMFRTLNLLWGKTIQIDCISYEFKFLEGNLLFAFL